MQPSNCFCHDERIHVRHFQPCRTLSIRLLCYRLHVTIFSQYVHVLFFLTKMFTYFYSVICRAIFGRMFYPCFGEIVWKYTWAKDANLENEIIKIWNLYKPTWISNKYPKVQWNILNFFQPLRQNEKKYSVLVR